LDIVIVELASHIINRNFDTVLGILTERGISTGENAPIGNVHGLVWADGHATEGIRTFVSSSTSSAGRENHAADDQ
jgi:hypothetical protein